MNEFHLRLGPEAMTALDKYASKRNLPRAKAVSLLVDEILFGRDYVAPKPVVPKADFIYVIKLGDLYKIGRSINPGKRIAGMQLPEKPHDDSFQWRCADAKRLEKDLHARFKHKRTHGEWFRLDVDDLDDLNNYCSERSFRDLPGAEEK